MAEIKIYATPSLLFRYRPLTAETVERELDSIREGYVYCPRFDQMNDPMEGLHRESSLFQRAEDYEDRKIAIEASINAHGIASFSEVHDHEPMWAHYADQFHGMCVAYRFSRLLAGLRGSAEFVRMVYSEEAPVLLKGKKTDQQLAKLTLSTKTIRWATEREWRLIRPKGRRRLLRWRPLRAEGVRRRAHRSGDPAPSPPRHGRDEDPRRADGGRSIRHAVRAFGADQTHAQAPGDPKGGQAGCQEAGPSKAQGEVGLVIARAGDRFRPLRKDRPFSGLSLGDAGGEHLQ